MAIDRDTAHTVPVDRDGCYTVAQFMRATGLGRTGLRAAERRGLRTFRSGGRKFVSGEAWFEFLSQQEKSHGPIGKAEGVGGLWAGVQQGDARLDACQRLPAVLTASFGERLPGSVTVRSGVGFSMRACSPPIHSP